MTGETTEWLQQKIDHLEDLVETQRQTINDLKATARLRTLQTPFSDVAALHTKFRLPLAKSSGGFRRPALLRDAEFRYRLAFLHEELLEFQSDHLRGDLAGAADALVDLVHVVLGTAHYMGLPFDALWTEVQRSNMEKVLRTMEDPIHARGTQEVLVKPQGWRPPNIERILDEHHS